MRHQIKVFILIVFLLILNGCAKKVLMKYAETDTIKMCEENFYSKFYMHFSENEKNEFKEIKTLGECQIFIDTFWQKRDTDPSTSENEYKTLLEKRVEDIEKEVLFQNMDTAGFAFKASDGFKGDPAKIYMLHGAPDFTKKIEGHTFVNLMVWIYGDENGKHRYRFLFYQKNSIQYVIFWPQWNGWIAIEEISKDFVELDAVYEELIQNEGEIFLISMISFSDNSNITPDKALKPPKPASEIAKELAPKIKTETPKTEEIVVANSFNSTIPAEFSYEITNDKLILKLEIKHEDLDWILKNNELVSELFIKTIVWDKDQKHEEEHNINIVSTKQKITEKNSFFFFESKPITLESEIVKASIYIKNNQKYNSWIEEIKR
ncbi:MAG TPA: GWxTD domain-containing protein [Candidatus Paceibacterota bacterium]